MTLSSNNMAQRLARMSQGVATPEQFRVSGKLTRVVGLTLEAVGFSAPVGTKCLVEAAEGEFFTAEIVGFANDVLYLMTTENTQGVGPGAKIIPLGSVTEVAVGNQLLGRILDGNGQPLDGLGPVQTTESYSLHGTIMNPLQRDPISQPLDVGIRAINSLLTIGVGQRIGLFAGSGVGKSVLLGMMSRFTKADVIVVGLIGERGREVKEFIEQNLGEEGLRRSVVVAAPADTSPLMRLYGAMRATSIAEYFRDQGANVLLLVDSITRFAQAQRELALAIGEPPATKGYPPSVFAKISQLVERAGNAESGGGSITAFYTVLVEGDDQQEPIADAVRSNLDGHIVLSRTMGERGIYPAIDIEASISRVFTQIASAEQQQMVRYFKQFYSKYQQNADLVNLGAYTMGSDAELDAAIALHPRMLEFIQQQIAEKVTCEQSMAQLQGLFAQQVSPANS